MERLAPDELYGYVREHEHNPARYSVYQSDEDGAYRIEWVPFVFHSADAPQTMQRPCYGLMAHFAMLGLSTDALRFYFNPGSGYEMHVAAQAFGHFQDDPNLPAFVERKMKALLTDTRGGVPSYHERGAVLSIYAANASLRLPHTDTGKGLFKIPLTIEEFAGKSYDELMEAAKTPIPGLAARFQTDAVPDAAPLMSYAEHAAPEHKTRTLDLLDKIIEKADEDFLIDLSAVWPTADMLVPRGETILFTGATGKGKSTVIEQIVVQHKHLRVLFVANENKVEREARRLIQIGKGLRYKLGEIDEVTPFIKAHREEAAAVIEHVHLVDDQTHGTDRYQRITELIDQYDYDLVVVDSLETVYTNAERDDLRRLRRVFLDLLKLARTKRLVLIVIHHIKQGANPKSVELRDLIGFGDAARQTEYAWALNLRDGFERQLVGLKAREHQELRLTLWGDPETFRWTDQPHDPNQTGLDLQGEAPDPTTLKRGEDYFDASDLMNAA